jgi:hypothetical protein
MTRRAVEQHLDEWTGVDGKGALEPSPNQKLDYDRGVQIKMDNSGLAVAMYPDAPGEYWLVTGQRATDAQAQQVGWDIHQGRRQRRETDTVARALELVRAVEDAERQKAQDAMREVETAKAGAEGQKETGHLAELKARADELSRKALAALAEKAAAEARKKAEQFEYESRHVRR